MRISSALICALLLATTALTSCGRKPAPPAVSEPAQQGYIRVEPAGKPVPGQLAVQQGVTEKEVGLAFFPGAKVNKSGLVQGPKGAIAGAELQTTKPHADVVSFYRTRYKDQGPTLKTLDEPTGPVTMLNWQNMQGNFTVVIKRENAGKRTIITLAKTSQ